MASRRKILLCRTSGGSQKYTGRSMFDAHNDVKVTGPEREAFMDDLQQTLNKFRAADKSKAFAAPFPLYRQSSN